MHLRKQHAIRLWLWYLLFLFHVLPTLFVMCVSQSHVLIFVPSMFSSLSLCELFVCVCVCVFVFDNIISSRWSFLLFRFTEVRSLSLSVSSSQVIGFSFLFLFWIHSLTNPHVDTLHTYHTWSKPLVTWSKTSRPSIQCVFFSLKFNDDLENTQYDDRKDGLKVWMHKIGWQRHQNDVNTEQNIQMNLRCFQNNTKQRLLRQVCILRLLPRSFFYGLKNVWIQSCVYAAYTHMSDESMRCWVLHLCVCLLAFGSSKRIFCYFFLFVDLLIFENTFWLVAEQCSLVLFFFIITWTAFSNLWFMSDLLFE